MPRSSIALFALSTALLLAACSGSVSNPELVGACTAGATEACACLGGGTGIQVCGPSDTFLQCICSTAVLVDAGKETGPGVDSGHSDGGHPKMPDATIVDAPSTDGTGKDATGADVTGKDVSTPPPDAGVECSPGALQCAPTGETAEVCSASGQWETLETCSGATPVCQAGACICPSGYTLCGGSCVDLTNDPTNCGSCSSRCDYTCSASACVPLELVSDTGAEGLGIATDGVNVYWLTGISAAALDVCPVTGCPASGPTQLIANISPSGVYGNMLGLVGQRIYWPNGAEIDDLALTTGAAMSTYASTGSPYQLVVDATNVYWTDATAIYECPLGVTCASPTTLVDLTIIPDGGALTTPPGEVAVDSGYVYWSDALGNINSQPLHGGTPVLIAAAQSPSDLIAFGGFVYWAAADGIYRCAADTACTPTPYYAEATSAFANLVTDGTTLYWTTGQSPGAVRKCPVGATCPSPTTLVDGVDTPSYIAIDNRSTYWLQGMATGTVYEFGR